MNFMVLRFAVVPMIYINPSKDTSPAVGVRRMVNLETHKLQHLSMGGILVFLHFQPQLVFIDVLGRFIYICIYIFIYIYIVSVNTNDIMYIYIYDYIYIYMQKFIVHGLGTRNL